MAKLIVEIDMGDVYTADQLKGWLEKDKKEWFPVGDNLVSVDANILKADPTDDDSYLFKLLGIIDHEKAS